MSEQRYKRHDPERTEPIRDFQNVFQDSAPSGGMDTGMEPPDWLGMEAGYDSAGDPEPGYDPRRFQDFATQGARRGYELLREQMERGQQYSEQVWGSAMPGSAGAFPDLRSIFEQTLYFYTDAVLRWADPFLPRRSSQGGSASSLPVHVVSSRPTRPSVKLFPGALGPFEALPLWAQDRAKPPIQELRFFREQSGGLALAIRIDDNQPVDLYQGVITTRGGSQPAGVVSVQILLR